MHGLGNDFVIIDATKEKILLSSVQIEYLADRRRGIGFDQLLIARPSSSPEADIDFQIFNADGSEALHCGNGARCFGVFLKNRKIIRKNKIFAKTKTSLIALKILNGGSVSVEMGVPTFEIEKIPFLVPPKPDDKFQVTFKIGELFLKTSLVSLGNPHAVINLDKIESSQTSELGRLIQKLPNFPESVNVGFMEIISRGRIKLRVFERGVGETPACGSGACAAVIAGIIQGRLLNSVFVNMPGGELQVDWIGHGNQVVLTGPTSNVFEGEFDT